MGEGSPEKYKPTQEELQHAENMMTDEQHALSKRREELEEERLKRAAQLGLSESASWSEIEKAEVARFESDKKSESERWNVINRALVEKYITYDEYLEHKPELGEAYKKFMEGRDKTRRGLALEYNLPEGSTWLDVGDAKNAERIKKRAIELGLSENASWSDIYIAERELERKNRARELGLKEDTPFEIMRYLDPEWEKKRFYWIEKFGLPDDTRWEKITSLIIDDERKKRAKRYGLPETASWAEINKAEKDSDDDGF